MFGVESSVRLVNVIARSPSPQQKQKATQLIAKRSITTYKHGDRKRSNYLPVGLVTPETDSPVSNKTKYAYDPHIDPALQFDPQRSTIERLLDGALSAKDLDRARSDPAGAEAASRAVPRVGGEGPADELSRKHRVAARSRAH